MNTREDIHGQCLNIINFPKIMTREDSVSFYSLLKKSGYFEKHDKITIEAIRQALLKRPDSVHDWIQYSEDQRCSPAWFFRQDGEDYEVGYFLSGATDTLVTKYSDRFTACATFIKHELEEVRLTD